jgi:hypothetical protein
LLELQQTLPEHGGRHAAGIRRIEAASCFDEGGIEALVLDGRARPAWAKPYGERHRTSATLPWFVRVRETGAPPDVRLHTGTYAHEA